MLHPLLLSSSFLLYNQCLLSPLLCFTLQQHAPPLFFLLSSSYSSSSSSCSSLDCRGEEESAMENGSKSFDLFPSLAAQNQEKEGRDLTFFYGGKVYSFHNISPLQIGAILSAAEQLKEASPPSLPSVVDLVVVVDDEREEKKGNYPKEVAAVVEQQHHLPLANKASLARFFANRKRKLQRVKDLENNEDSTTSFHFVKKSSNDGFDGKQLFPASKKQRDSCTSAATTTQALPLFPL